MGYIDKHLLKGEQIAYGARLHWVIFLRPFFLLAISLSLLVTGKSVIPNNLLSQVPPEINTFTLYELDMLRLLGAAIFILFGFPAWISAFVRKISSEFGISNKRVLIKLGFIKRNSFETLLSKVEGIGVVQGIFGRILDFGTIIIRGTGGSKEYFHKIANPLEFRKHVQEQISLLGYEDNRSN
jgi:uncharacterized membrane protein YdbT with pleckstrin-like domain